MVWMLDIKLDTNLLRESKRVLNHRPLSPICSTRSSNSRTICMTGSSSQQSLTASLILWLYIPSLQTVNLFLPSPAVVKISHWSHGVPSPVLNKNRSSFPTDLLYIHYRPLLRLHEVTKHRHGKLVWSGHTIVVGQRTCPNDRYPSEVLLGCAH